MAKLRKLFKNSTYYLISHIVVVAASAIALPIWTRLLSQREYGMFSLFNVTIAMMATFSKCGLQHSAIRFFSQTKLKQNNLAPPLYFTTMLIGGVCLIVAITSISMVVLTVSFRSHVDHWFMEILPLLGTIVVIQATNNILTIFLRAEQQVKLYSLVHIIRRYSRLGFAVLLVLLVSDDLHNIYRGWVISGSLILLLLIARLVYLKRLSPRQFSLTFLKQALKYGFPLAWFELSNRILTIGDRYVIQYYLGAAAVGIYSVGYNMADLFQSLLSFPLRLAVVPMYLSLWDTSGEEKTVPFLGQALKYYCMLGIPLAIGVSWFSKDIVTLMATAEFVEAYRVIPYIISPLIVYGAFSIYGAGLYIQKKTTLLMYSTLLATGVNIVLNIILVPRLGILGAAFATLLAYAIQAVMIFSLSYHYLRVPVDLHAINKYILLSVTTIYLASTIAAEAHIVMKIMIVLVLYAGGLLLIDKHLRCKASTLLLRRSSV